VLLTEVTIESFKTIITEQKLEVDSAITVLLGANESGKTNLLQAIACLSDEREYKHEDISKANRRKYSQKVLPIISFKFALSEKDNEKIAKIIPAFSNRKELIICRTGNGSTGYSAIFPVTESEKREKLTKEQTADIQDLIRAKQAEKQNILLEIARINIKNSSQQSTEFAAKDKEDFHAGRQQLEAKKRMYNAQVEELSSEISHLEKRTSLNNEPYILKGSDAFRIMINLLPKVSYITHFERIPESLPITEIKEQQTTRSIAVGNLLKLGEITDFSVLDEEQRLLKPILVGVSNEISRKFSETWTQEQVEIQLEKQGDNLTVSIAEKIAISSVPSERSEGFQWLLSFFAIFAIDSPNETKEILLLDEPAIRIHPKGQKDLLEVFEKMASNRQIIYTTHSPFLIDRNFPGRIRVLEKNLNKGTLINNKPYTDGKTRFWEPLRSSIGVCLGDLFSLGESNLIVEGISDQIIITHISNQFAKNGYPFIDSQRVSIVAAMGATCEESIAKLAFAEKLRALSLVDNDSKGNRVMTVLQKNNIPVVSVGSLKGEAITIEDLIPEDAYIASLNSLYAQYCDYKQFVSHESQDVGGIVQRINQHLKDIGYDHGFDKTGVAKQLAKQVCINKQNIAQYEPFRKLFETVNNLKQPQ
jgi:predicted ATP-dependent endonuclease of OLD family